MKMMKKPLEPVYEVITSKDYEYKADFYIKPYGGKND